MACFGTDKHEAFLKALVSTGFTLPLKKRTVLLSTGQSALVASLENTTFLHSLNCTSTDCLSRDSRTPLVEDGFFAIRFNVASYGLHNLRH